MSDADRQLRQLAKHKDSTVRARATVLAELFASLESQNQALQEALRLGLLAMERHDGWCGHYRDAPGDPIHHQFTDAAYAALSPTQETDEPDCARCGNERTVGGYGTDERFPCPVCRPTQETDAG